MVLLGISLLVASLSFLLYRHPPGFWYSFQRQLAHIKNGKKPTEKSTEQRNIDLNASHRNHARDEKVTDAAATTTAAIPPAATEQPNLISTSSSISTINQTSTSNDAASSPETTPKALPSQPAKSTPSIPSFSLDDPSTTSNHKADVSSDEDDDDDEPPIFPAKKSAQRAGSSARNAFTKSPPAPVPSLSTTSTSPIGVSSPASTLMPPPPRPTPPSAAARLRAGPSTSTSSSTLSVPSRIPPTSLSPAAAARARPTPSSSLSPSSSSPSSSSLSPSLSNPPTKSRASQKVILQPGHSPLDWAELCRSHARAQAQAFPSSSSSSPSAVPSILRVPPSLLKLNNGRHGRPAWTSYYGRVYDVTAYLPFHPGGEKELLRAAGRDGAKLFEQVHPWVNWESMLNVWMVGVMVDEQDADANANANAHAQGGQAGQQSRGQWDEMD
ncbi:hypothetical protein L228DRAFT_245094 [Xylona heveae TC161]|uniref:Cytochrome b5 heme-binding domain-containing protein n=1 Tax=Xylona heveae (strain CBS 132557 / TC161) TaxID=1328760 RepID=A0A165I0P8_XYLHT|nr:hypothetical protein L228DRAFT_245094 [Xylona heveae TC161]KZF24194.1 hypothetical protein L228DRAFT_245094 [Xylona heveae TC161]